MPRGVVGEQLQRVGLLDVRAEHEHAALGLRSRISSAARRPSSVWVGGIRTSTIATSGLCAPTLRSRSSASPAWATTSSPASSSSAREALAQQHAVIGQDYAHGILARIVVPDAGRGVDLAAGRRAAARRSARPRRPEPAVGVGAADAVVLTSTTA